MSVAVPVAGGSALVALTWAIMANAERIAGLIPVNAAEVRAAWLAFLGIVLFAVAGLRLQARVDEHTYPRMEILFVADDSAYSFLEPAPVPGAPIAVRVTDPVRRYVLGVRNISGKVVTGVKVQRESLRELPRTVTLSDGTVANHVSVPFWDRGAVYMREKTDSPPWRRSADQGATLARDSAPTYFGIAYKYRSHSFFYFDYAFDNGEQHRAPGEWEIRVRVVADTAPAVTATFKVWLDHANNLCCVRADVAT